MAKDPKHILKEVFGFDSFRRGQGDIIEQILNGQDVLGIMPTGAGKSLCYQIPALAIGGVSVVISPLISLMKDQVDALQQNGVRAAALNSSLEWDEIRDIFSAVRAGEISLLYVAPERLESESFNQFLQSIAVRLFIVDEAHCVSQWGHDFRPSYLKIADTIKGFATRPVVAAFTATATPEVRDDIADKLGLRNPYLLTTGFDRENLFFQVEHSHDKMAFVLDYVKKTSGSSGIIYCATRRNVEEVCEKLKNSGLSAVRYHAGLSERERRLNQEAFIYDRANIMVATNAFGMGIDKSNVRYVLHYNMPANIDAYYQEAGRAGRDGTSADCVLLFAARDVNTARFFIEQCEEADSKRAGYRKLQAMVDLCNTGACLRAHILNYFAEKNVAPRCNTCGNCVSIVERIDITVAAQKILSCVYRMAEAANQRQFGSVMLIDVLRGSEKKQIRDLQFETLSTWGIMKEYSKESIKEIIHFLVADGYLQFSDAEYPTLSFAPKALPFLRGKEKLLMRKYEPKTERKAPLPTTSKAHTEIANAELFELLRALRREFAEEQNVPPYVVFADSVLNAMCMRLPRNEGEFLAVPGVGEVKLERYGKRFLEIINEWRRR